MRLREMTRKRPVAAWAKELIDECLVSRERRKDAARYYRQFFYQGSDTGTAKDNLIYDHIDRLSSYLFSPSEVRFLLTFDSDETKDWEEAVDLASRFINRSFSMRNCDLAFSWANEIGLVDGSCFVKLTWGRHGYKPHIVKQQFMGVLREDSEDLDEQEAFTHSFYLSQDQVRRMLINHRDAKELMNRMEATFSDSGASEITDDSYFHQIVTGGQGPVGMGTATGSQSSVGVFGPPIPMLAPEVAARLVRVDDLWVWNDDAKGGEGDWTTIRYVDPGIVLEGEDIQRNMGDIPGEQPFIKVAANDVADYMWGRSEVANIASRQNWFNARVDNVDDIFGLRARPPRSFTGFSGLTQEKMRALLMRGGMLTDDSPTGKIESHAPDMPPEALEYIAMIKASIDASAGMTPILSGQGAPGVRAGNQTNTLLRTSSPRIRDRALQVEKQCAAFGNLCFELSRAKEARVFVTPAGKEFTLESLPKDAMVMIDSHTSSPAFSGDNVNLAFALARAGAIDGEDLIELTHPPRQDSLILKYRARKKAEQEFLQQHPELLLKGHGGSHAAKK
jgi:hypothetical protein